MTFLAACNPIIGSLVKFPSIFAAGVELSMQDAFAFLFLPTFELES
jgi:hypothetical protein